MSYHKFRTAISYRFIEWLDENIDVFTAHRESLWIVSSGRETYPEKSIK